MYNDVAIPSDFGVGFNWHPFLVVSDTVYLKATNETKPTAPTKSNEPRLASVRTNTRETHVEYNLVKEEFREYNIDKTKYLQYNNISRCLVNCF